MKLIYEPRLNVSRARVILLPLIAILLTFLLSMLIFWLLGKAPWQTARTIFINPFLEPYSRPEILIKASPLLIIAIGLAIGFRANVWNIGAEGQYIMGAIGATSVAMAVYPGGGFWLLPMMAIAGMALGALWGFIPAFLRVKFNTSEILVSLMLVYVADLILRIVVSGVLKDPDGLSFPQSRLFQDAASLPIIWEGTRVHLGVIFAFLIAIAAAVFMRSRRLGFDIRIVGQAPRAAKYSGVRDRWIIYFCLGLSGALAGLAGMFEVSGPIGQLTPSLPTFYGFTAIIVAFLGRLNPWAIILAAIVIAVTYIGGETAQIFMGLPAASIRVIQGMMLFLLLGVEVFGRYKIRIGA